MYDLVMGLEVHVQMNTQTKIFCGCNTAITSVPNSQTCPICQGHPGTLPLLNEEVIHKAVTAALATHCEVHLESLFDRKSYFYPDLPKGYQTTQFYKPICSEGHVEIKKADGTRKKIRINHIHIEEDAGKLVHGEIGNKSYVDLNRAGTPLLEIVSEPDIYSVEEAVLYATKLRQIMVYMGVTDGNMQEGSVRFDVNLSLKPKGSSVLGTRTETKNLNSFTALRKAIEMEVERQVSILDSGEKVEQETRLFNLDRMESRSLRKKGEGEEGYLYFRDPDIPALKLTQAFVKEVEKSLPPSPSEYEERFIKDYALREEDVQTLLSEKEYVLFFEEAVRQEPSQAQKIANFFLTDLLGQLKDKTLSDIPITGKSFGDIFTHIAKGEISLKIAKDILPQMIASGQSAKELIAKQGLVQISDSKMIEEVILKILSANKENIASYRNGKTQVLGFFVGQVMKETKGQANPAIVNDLLKKNLSDFPL